MGSCGAKTCTPLIHRLFREEGVPEEEIVDQPKRPLFMEVAARHLRRLARPRRRPTMAVCKRTYDVIIIGAGSVGTPAALCLAEAGLRTLVLDGNASAGQGSNKHAIGGLRATHSDPAKIRICLRSLEIFSGWKEDRGEDLEWRKGGYAFVAYTERDEERPPGAPGHPEGASG